MKITRVLLLFGLLLPAGFLGAQEFTGQVTDNTGAVMQKAAVTARNVDTGVETATVTNRAGVYTIPYLLAGNYSVSVRATGFETASILESFCTWIKHRQ